MNKNKVIISLGSNLGDRKENLLTALKMLNEFSNIIYKSRIFHSEPWGFNSKNMFLNLGVLIGTTLTPIALLNNLKKIEFIMGRRTKQKYIYEDRLIDLDILIYENFKIVSNKIHLPHPKINERKFLLLILKDIYSKNPIMGLNKTADEILEKCVDKTKVSVFE